MKKHKDEFSIERMSKVLGVSRAGFYRYINRRPSERSVEDTRLAGLLKKVHEENRRVYGYRRLILSLKDRGELVGKGRVIRLMKAHQIVARYKKPFRVTTQSSHKNEIAANLLGQDFSALKPNEKWVSDISYIPTQTGFLYLAVIIDLYSRMVVGMSMSSSLNRHLILHAFSQACLRRHKPKRILFHSDRGVQYTSEEFKNQLAANRAIQSMSRKGNCWDNAVSESFFSTLKRELLGGRKFANKEEAKTLLFDYIEIFYNRKRKHSAVGYLPPYEFEKAEFK